ARDRNGRARPRLGRLADRRRTARRNPVSQSPSSSSPGTPRTPTRVAIAGVGNCASSLVQGVEYYREALPGDEVPGLMHVELGGYHVRDVAFVAAFDMDAAKVGEDLGKAIFQGQNNTIRFAEVPEIGVEVLRAPTMDGWGTYYRRSCEESLAPPVDVAAELVRSGAEVLVSYLP